MCTRFVYRGKDMITGFNFDIDLSVWKHKVIENNCFAHIKPFLFSKNKSRKKFLK